MALHQDMPSHLHLPGCQTLTTSQKYPSQYNTTTKGCKWLGTTSNAEAADGLASRYAKPSAHTRPPNIHNLQITCPIIQHETKGCKWLGTTSNLGAADGLASRYAKPSALTGPPNIHNLQNTWPNTAWQPKVVNGLAPHQTQEPQMALHQDMPSHLHLPGRQTFTTSQIPGPIQHDNQRL